MNMPKEAAIQRDIIRYLRSIGAWVFNVHGSPYQQVGVPDLLVGYQGRFYALEVKRPGGRLSPAQVKVIGDIQASGCIAARVENIEEVEILLNGDA